MAVVLAELLLPAALQKPVKSFGSRLWRMAESNEIAIVVAFLASDAASYITATSIFADGGIMPSSPGL